MTTYSVPEFKLSVLREAEFDTLGDNPAALAAFCRQQIVTHPHFDPTRETFWAIFLNCRCRITGFTLISIGTENAILVSPQSIFRPAILAAARHVVLVHNHPSGDPSPSEGDIRVTLKLDRCGKELEIAIVDHLILGRATPDRPKDFLSLRDCGYLSNS